MSEHAQRRRLLARIHAQAQALGLTEADYRAILAERLGVTSAADLDLAGLRRLAGLLGGRPEPVAAIAPMVRRIHAQCHALGRPVPAYADALARRLYGVDRLEWCTPAMLRGITAALRRQQRREGVEVR